MSLGQHLLELRKRLFLAAAGILVGAIAGWFLSDFVWDALREPIYAIIEAQNRTAQLNYPDITSAFDLKLKISEFVGESVHIAAVDRVGDLIGFFDGVGRDGREGLDAIPFAAGNGIAQAAHDRGEAVEGHKAP